ncbi:MAG: hypothetical protein PHE38_09035 [Alishewanella agri]|jgi:hypothetical protein|nr:hypothetical protein [Alishewanella agri]
MRWFSGFAILLYLSLLCTPQGFAVHDLRLAPLADHQITAVTAKVYSLNERATAADDNDDNASSSPLAVAAAGTQLLIAAVFYCYQTPFHPSFSARAPPQQ